MKETITTEFDISSFVPNHFIEMELDKNLRLREIVIKRVPSCFYSFLLLLCLTDL